MRADGTVINSTTAAKPGDTLELYGTGFGATTPAVAAGTVFQGSAPTANAVTLTLGGVPATVLFAGLAGAGLYQINITVPAMADGDYAVIAQIAGLTTQGGVLLRIRSSGS